MKKFCLALIFVSSLTSKTLLLLGNEGEPMIDLASIDLVPDAKISDNPIQIKESSKEEKFKKKKTFAERTKFFTKGFLCACVSVGSIVGGFKVVEDAYLRLITNNYQNFMDDVLRRDRVVCTDGCWQWKYARPSQSPLQEILARKRSEDSQAYPVAILEGVVIMLIGYANYKFLLPEAKKNLQEAFS